MSEDQYDEIQELKKDTLAELKSSLEELGDSADTELTLQVLEDITSSPELNSDETILESKSILDSIISNPNKKLAPSESDKVVGTMN